MATQYGKKAQDKVERAMHEMKHGELESGNSHKKVTNPKQAIAIGLSEARKAFGKVPPPKKQTEYKYHLMVKMPNVEKMFGILIYISL